MNSAADDRYSTGAIILHWLTALLMIFMIFFGEELMEARSAEAATTPAGTFLPSIHVSVGVTILVLTLLRLVWRLGHAAPPYPATMKGWELTPAKVTHRLFYVLADRHPAHRLARLRRLGPRGAGHVRRPGLRAVSAARRAAHRRRGARNSTRSAATP